MNKFSKSCLHARRITRFFLVMVVILFGISQSSFAKDGSITISGSTTVLPIAQNLAEVFMDRNLDVDISVQGGGSGVGIASLIDGACDIANASRPIKDKEIDKARSKGIDPQPNVVAMDGIAVIIHSSNPVSALSQEQLTGIFTGKLSNWGKIGGPRRKIVVVSRDSASGTFEAFNHLALGKKRVRPDALMQASNQAVASIVSKTPGAIGYVGLGYLSAAVKPVMIEGIMPSKATVLSGDYILARPLFMYTNGKPTGAVKNFFEFALSEEGQKMVRGLGFVGMK